MAKLKNTNINSHLELGGGTINNSSIVTVGTFKFFEGGTISSAKTLPDIDINDIAVVAYRATSGNPAVSLPSNSGYYDYALILGHAYHSSGGVGVSNGISQQNILGGTQIARLTTNGAYTSILIIYKRVS